MALRIRFQYPSGNHLGYSVERLADGLLFDFADSTFKATPGTQIAPLPEDAGIFIGRYRATLTPTVWLDGDYTVTVHHTAESNVVLAELGATMKNNDDATYFPSITTTTYPTVLSGTLTIPSAITPP